ncbi:MAG: YrhK family protein, partial [Alkalibacterium sp.]|uniref:YrhK family protein n=1 Tax=Alkalibacterium sp. TaxID=1872447 RepID=UPI002649C956
MKIIPEVKRKKRAFSQYEREDLIVKLGKFRFYFQNYYTIVSLVNDILIGSLYLLGSITSVLEGPQWIQKWSYLAGALFLLMRPILKIVRNIFIYNKKEFQNEVNDLGFDGKELSENRAQNRDTSYGETK